VAFDYFDYDADYHWLFLRRHFRCAWGAFRCWFFFSRRFFFCQFSPGLIIFDAGFHWRFSIFDAAYFRCRRLCFFRCDFSDVSRDDADFMWAAALIFRLLFRWWLRLRWWLISLRRCFSSSRRLFSFIDDWCHFTVFHFRFLGFDISFFFFSMM